ncbi:hypothetical protein [Synechococcus sp. GFB01]|uniref:hypothetical protein n=1 Tax=Synechococcus sp. GFB01 TaxID=1662190 RepID=UPI00064FCF65|nr:hypothetical protein [Synechococcus sp. GFB01]KMM17691.1 hypothetical protein SYNGFB01_02575 [Synechococcus sp. GFB01]
MGLAPSNAAIRAAQAAAGTLAFAALAAAGQGFGRWEGPVRHCTMTANGRTHRCLELELEQNQEGLLTARFVGPGQGGPLASRELAFSGLLGAGQQPMRCGADGRCLPPDHPLQLRLTSVAWSRFDGRGLAEELPLARLARGQCLLDRQTIRCNARLEPPQPNAAPWSAEARLRP